MVVSVQDLPEGYKMFDPKQHGENMRRHFEQMTPEQHADIYAQFYHAYLTNEEGGYAEQAEFSRRQMQSLLSFGKVPEAERLVIEARTCQIRAQVKQDLDEILTLYQEQPNITRH